MLRCALILIPACTGIAQSLAPVFEVASVKRSPPIFIAGGGLRGGPGTASPSQVTGTGVLLKTILMAAYDLRSYQIDGPRWVAEERYDIHAKLPVGTTKEQFQLMFQNLLAERFQLAIHHEMRRPWSTLWSSQNPE